jgi:hypothetical protein
MIHCWVTIVKEIITQQTVKYSYLLGNEKNTNLQEPSLFFSLFIPNLSFDSNEDPVDMKEPEVLLHPLKPVGHDWVPVWQMKSIVFLYL